MGDFRDGVRRWAGLALLLSAALLVFMRPAEDLSPAPGPVTAPRTGPVVALVTRVIDGDTIEAVVGGRREDVRYIGVDTPETVAPGEPVDCFGPQASAFNHRLVEGRRVELRLGVERRDDYGRLLAYVRLGRVLVNAELVRRGFARTLTISPNDAKAPLLRRLERRAGRLGRGLWGRCVP